MCEVCAIFGIGDHWTESAKLATPSFPAEEIQSHRRERARRIELLNSLLGAYGIQVGDWDGEALKVENSEGRMRVVPDLSTIWPVIETLAGREFDPLNKECFSWSA